MAIASYRLRLPPMQKKKKNLCKKKSETRCSPQNMCRCETAKMSMFFVTASRLLLDELFLFVCISSLQLKETIQLKMIPVFFFSKWPTWMFLLERLKASHWAAVECRLINRDKRYVWICHNLQRGIDHWIFEGKKIPKQIFLTSTIQNFFFFFLNCAHHLSMCTQSPTEQLWLNLTPSRSQWNFRGRQGSVVQEIKCTLESQNEVSVRVGVFLCVFLSLYNCSATSNK